MSEFELSTLVMVAMLLGGLGGYSYWQIRRAQSLQRKPIESAHAHTGAYGAGSMTHDAVGVHTHTASDIPLHRTSPDDMLASAVQSAQDSKRYESVQNAYVPTGVGYALHNESDDEDDVYVRSTAPVISPSPPVYGSKHQSAYDVKPIKENHYAYTPELQTRAQDEAQAFAQTHAAAHSIEHDIISYHDTVTHEIPAVEPVFTPPFKPSVDAIVETPATASTELTAHAPMGSATTASGHAPVYPSTQTPIETPVETSIPATTWLNDPLDVPVEDLMLAADPQFFNQQDLTEQATFSVFDPLIRFSSWIENARPSPIQAIDGVLDLMVSQPKNAHDIERALYDLRLDTDLPLRLYGLRAGQVVARHSEDTNAARQWQPLEQGVLYSGLRLTLQLANASSHASTQLIHDWFELAQRLARRLAAHVNVWPDPAALASYAVYLHDISKRLGAPLVVQLHKPQGLWAAYEVHQQMTQWGLQLDANGQYVARNRDGHVLYRVLNDLNNPRAQDFYRDALATMHVQTLSFCLDLARVKAEYHPQERLWHDMSQLAHDLKAQWCNGMGQNIVPDMLFSHAAEHIPAYVQQLAALGVPAGSLTMKRLLKQRP
ncbi:hypothetical protein DTO96_102321 [Ephemeroptericola cinctiostellae]|uniref:Uncharacterized protein n=1 Tax=Ephemeroptericola cinctiostellae TaxID=2268024 RepID=A0A345DDX8_9BURK|nr:cell division protein ZipA C-terminal FtsZ-binding domain-containing protein [Ephemeroptericola cinctiostellae]AXF86566.1 hypothetical protein DTO96_102321 [Ephemeroptericola cinctiostellae]